MIENENYLKNYNSISEDVRYAANSIIRLKILAALYEKPQNVKELASNTNLNYSSISVTIHGLELKEFVHRESNRYYLSNSIKIQMANVLELKEVVNILNDFFNITDGHVIDMIPEDSVSELFLLRNAELMESSGVDAYKINNHILNVLKEAKNARCIMPFYHVEFNKRFNSLIKKGRYVEVIVAADVLGIYEKRSKIKYLSSFKFKNNFLLIVTDKVMIFGLFKDNGFFDQNRILSSQSRDAILWANNLFKNFKKKNK